MAKNNNIKCLTMRNEVSALAENLGDEKLKTLFLNCFFSTLDTTVSFEDDGTAYVFTGDIPAMWLRDSSAQVIHYLPFAKKDADVKHLIKGLIKRQMRYIAIDPYANAFNRTANGNGFREDIMDKDSPWVWERKYELDSLCYPLWLSYHYYLVTDDSSVFDNDYFSALNIILSVFETEQHHDEKSLYRHQRFSPDANLTDTLIHNGKGPDAAYTGMVYSAYRPSDDACTYGYLVPSNMFAVVVLKQILCLEGTVFKDNIIRTRAEKLAKEIDSGIKKYAVITEDNSQYFAYEVDGFGNSLFMDDANVPSLLAAPFLGYCSQNDPIYLATRKRVLSHKNPYYFEGKFASGIGSPHTPDGYIWHIGLCVEGLTTDDSDTIKRLTDALVSTDAEKGCMHEGFLADNPNLFTREWFAWANSMFALFILNKILKVN